MKSSSGSEIHLNCFQCFLCREWGWDVSKAFDTDLCLPCYVDVLEVRQSRLELQRRGVLGSEPETEPLREGPDENPDPMPSTWSPPK